MTGQRELEKLLGRLATQSGLGVATTAKTEETFRRAVAAWCEYLDWPQQEVGRFVQERKGALVNGLASLVRDSVAPSSDEPEGFSPGMTAKLFSRAVGLANWPQRCIGAINRMDTDHYLLLALGAAAVGYVGYRLLQVPKATAKCASPEAPRRPAMRTATSGGVRRRWTVILVVNAERSAVLDALRSGSLGGLGGDELYQATQALWHGPREHLQKSGMEESFSSGAITTPSEYDVYLVQFETDARDSGLTSRANQLDRVDAFRRLVKGSPPTRVSDRLPSDAYARSILYAR